MNKSNSRSDQNLLGAQPDVVRQTVDDSLLGRPHVAEKAFSTEATKVMPKGEKTPDERFADLQDMTRGYLTDEEEAKLWRLALNHITFLKEETTMPEAQNNPFAGKTVVATGKLENYTRDGIQMKLLSLGARPSSSVSKKTDYLIVGENAGSKLTKAQTMGVTTLTEQQFLQMLADAGIEV